MFMGTSPTSSINSVPLSASSKRPILRVTAPVNAPFSWPKNSFSKSVSETEAGCTGRKGPFAAAVPVDEVGHDLLAHARFPEQERGRIRSRHHPRPLKAVPERGAAAPYLPSLPSSVRSFTA